MTKRSRQPNQQFGILTSLILTGSLIATIVGARLLAHQETAEASVPQQTITISAPASSSAITLPKTGQVTALELKPIPQVALPQLAPVARSRSSM